MIQAALPGLGMGTPQHTAALRAVQQLSRHIAQGAPTAGTQKTMFSDMMNGTVRNAALQKLFAQAGGGGQPAQPSMPTPGA